MSNSDQGNWQALGARLDRKPLRPLSESCLNEKVPANGPLKRKRGLETESYELGKPFTILVGSQEYTVDPVTDRMLDEQASLPHKGQLKLVPRLLIPRSCLPLAYFDLEADSHGSTGSRIFTASEQTLEVLAASKEQTYEPRILIAEHGDDHRLYAVESVRQGVYAMCRLGEWVELDDFGKPPAKAKKISHGDPATSIAYGDQWWRKAALDIGSKVRETQGTSQTQGIRLAMKPTPSRTKPTTIEYPSTASVDKNDCKAINAEIMSVTAVNGGDEPLQPSALDPVDIYGLLRVQYLEALYINKVNSKMV
jgi:DNA replication regulator SLD3